MSHSPECNDLPRHVAIIMDGNGRWAQARGLPRIEGHQRGYQSVRAVVECAGEMGIEVLTLWMFSSDNWKRPREEVDALMMLFEEGLNREIDELDQRSVAVRHLGRKEGLPPSLQAALAAAQERTRNNTGLVLCFAINYGGREEIADAVKRLADDVLARRLSPDQVDEEHITSRLYFSDLPDVDLLIRTGGDCRISNFLLWEMAYSELYLSPVMWPDFGAEEFKQAVEDYGRRERRFGGVPAASRGDLG